MRPEHWLFTIPLRLRSLFRWARADQELDDELRDHLERKTAEYVGQGMTQEEAHRRARLDLGGIEQTKEKCRDARRVNWIQDSVQDLRFSLRMLRKSPGFAVVATLTLTLGIGANTAIFSVVNGVLLNPLPFPDSGRLVSVYATRAHEEGSMSYPDFCDLRTSARTLTALGAYRPDNFNLIGSNGAELVPVDMVSADFFSVLEVKPTLGRLFSADDDQLGAAPVALISAGFWKRKLESSVSILGTAITLNGTAYTIVGTIPSSFHFDGRNWQQADIYVPVGQWNDSAFRSRRGSVGLQVIGRLKADISIAQAQAETDGIAGNLAAAYPEADRSKGIALIPLKKDIVGNIESLLLVLWISVLFVLLIACVNLANLVLARSTGRTRELAVRVALGATQERVIRQLLTESLLLSFFGGTLGLLVATWGTRMTLRVFPLPRSEEIGLDIRVLLFAVGISLLAGTLFGLSPALKSQSDLEAALKEGGRGAVSSRHRTRNVLVVAEVAISLVLLVGAGLMIHTLARLLSVNPGFRPDEVLTFRLNLAPSVHTNPAAIRAAIREVEGRAASVPGIEAASAVVGSLPILADSELPFWLEGQPKPQDLSEMKRTLFYAVGPDYFDAMGIPLERGRLLTYQDNDRSLPVMLIDDVFARKYFPEQDPIGKAVNLGIIGIQSRVVGVVGHVKQSGLDEGARGSIEAELYLPLVHVPDRFMPLLDRAVRLVLRSQGPPLKMTESVRHAIQETNREEVAYGFESMDNIISGSLNPRRFLMIVLSIFAAIGLVLCCLGIYGVLSYSVRQRTKEIGIRMALGAGRTIVLRLILGQAIKMMALGLTVGIIGALSMTRLMSSLLFQVTTTDPLTFAGVSVGLLATGVVASYIPARRATRVDPMVALKYE